MSKQPTATLWMTAAWGVLTGLAMPAQATVRDVPASYPTIQAAIDAAASSDEVVVAPGAYQENIDFHGKSITVRSWGGAVVTTLNGGGTGRAVTMVSSETRQSVLDGFTVTGQQGGLLIQNTNTRPMVLNCTFVNCQAEIGAAMLIDAAGPLIIGCTFSGNNGSSGGAVFGTNGATCSIQACTFTSNTATGQGGAIFNCCGSALSVTDCSFTENQAGGGGAIFSINPDTSLTVTGSLFVKNVARSFGGAIQLHQTHAGSLRGCRFTGNSGGYGGAIDAEGASIWLTLILDGCLFDKNSAPPWGEGSAIRCNQLTDGSRLDNCTLADNTGTGGAFVFHQPGSVSITNSVFQGNLLSSSESPGQIGGEGTTVVTYSLVQGGYPGVGNIDANPQFVSPFNGNYHLQTKSPCIDAGLNSAVPAQLVHDLDGSDRILDGNSDGTALVDMGVYETHACSIALTEQPTDQTADIGQTVTFSAMATGMGALQYQWSKDGIPLSDWARVSGSRTASLTIKPVETNEEGVYTLTVTDLCGAIGSSPATLTVICNQFVAIAEQPASQPLEVGRAFSFSVLASGTGSFSYQWRKDGASLIDDDRISGATKSTLAVKFAQPDDAGEYDVLVSNACESAVSQAAVLSPLQPRPTKPRVLKMFGQRNRQEAASVPVTGNNIYHASGVVVDRSLTPNAIYSFDTGNSRILGFRSYASPGADRVFGQPDAYSSAANGDCNVGLYGTPSSTSLCLSAYPIGTNVAEQWLRLHLDVDGQGNLYVPDTYNDRVLIYYAPFSDDKTGGRGDSVADRVLGQPDFTSNGPNHGRGPDKPDAHSLHISFGGFDYVASRGVSVDGEGNVWIADTFNYRVLRFPSGATDADLVLGQPDFTTCEGHPDMGAATLATLCTPTIARVDPETGELYVVDEYPGGFPARIVVFKPPFVNGMSADRLFPINQALEGDYAGGYQLTHATGLVFNPFKSSEWIDPATMTHRYSDGFLWLNDRTRCMLLDKSGNILLAVGAPDTTTFGGRYDVYGRNGLDPTIPFNLIWPGGMIGFDSGNNIYLADEPHSCISRYDLPYLVSETPNGLALPAAHGGLFPQEPIDPVHWRQDRVGSALFHNQLMVRDHQRYMVWNDYLSKPDGAPADLFIGQNGGDNINNRNNLVDRSHHAIDNQNRMWSGSEHGKMILYQLPFQAGAEPLRTLIPLYWADEPNTEVAYHTGAVTFDPLNRHLWVLDGSRLLRVRNPDDWSGKLLVDAIIGQTDKYSNQINRGMSAPDAFSLGAVNSIRFDRLGNLFVVDNTYECHPNGRVIAFLAEDLGSIDNMFPNIQAKKVYCVETFDQTDICRSGLLVDQPFSPVSVAFSRNNEMVIGNDGYYRDPQKRVIRQLYLYHHPLEKPTPDEVIELPMGAAAEMQFDDADHLIVLDHTWNRAWVIDVFGHTPADFDQNGIVNADDLYMFSACATGAAIAYNPAALPASSPGCTLVPDASGFIAADFDRDGDVDQEDFGVFQRCYSGANNTANPNCANLVTDPAVTLRAASNGNGQSKSCRGCHQCLG